MTAMILHKNFLVAEGRLLAAGKVHQITADEWLYLYDQIKADLDGRQAEILSGFEVRIRGRFLTLDIDSVAA